MEIWKMLTLMMNWQLAESLAAIGSLGHKLGYQRFRLVNRSKQ